MASPLVIAGFFALGGGLIALAASTAASRAPGSPGAGGVPPDTCENLLKNLPADLAAAIGASKTVADLQAVANALDARGMKPAGDCLRAQVAAGILNKTTGGGGPLGGTPAGFTPTDCTFSDIPDSVATPPGFPTPVAPGMGSLRKAAYNAFLTMKSSKNGTGLMVLGQTLNSLGYSNSAACVIQWATLFGGVPSGGGMMIAPGAAGGAASTLVGGGQSLHDMFDAALRSGGLAGAPGAPATAATANVPQTMQAPAAPPPPPPSTAAIAVPRWDFEQFGFAPAMG